jgi:hypothetical protein
LIISRIVGKFSLFIVLPCLYFVLLFRDCAKSGARVPDQACKLDLHLGANLAYCSCHARKIFAEKRSSRMTTSLLLEKPICVTPATNYPQKSATPASCSCAEKHMASHNAMCKACSEKATQT